MAIRPVFVPIGEGSSLVRDEMVAFHWHPGLSVSQKQKSIDSLHASAAKVLGKNNILEISSKSRSEVGVALSAFNLKFTTSVSEVQISVECAFQGSKVFEHGGPYKDIYGKSSREAKSDERLRSSGKLIGFRFSGVNWSLSPKTAFYDWLYINTLMKNGDLARELDKYDAFTDIEFNPEKSINCQAHSVALFVALKKKMMLEKAMSSRDEFLNTISLYDKSKDNGNNINKSLSFL